MSLALKFISVLSIIGFLCASQVFCAEGTDAEGNEEEAAYTFTQGQLAITIVRSLGLEDEIGFDQTVQAYLNLLQSRGVAPIDGWDANALVTKEVLATVVVKTLGWSDQLVDNTDVNDYVRVFAQAGLDSPSIEEVQKVLSNIFVINVLTEVIGPSITFGGDLTPTTGF